MSRFLLPLVVALAVPSAALALATEQFGNKPIAPAQFGLPPEFADIANLPSRVYFYEVNAWPVFFYRGDVAAANDALTAFAKLKVEHKQVRLVAGPGQTKNLQRTKDVAFDWTVSIPNGFVRPSAENPAVMTVHITVPKPTAAVDAAAVKKLIGELDSPQFAVRDAATKKLREVGFAGVPHFQAALKATESAETRTRLEALLDRLKGIDLQRLDLPAGLPVFGPKDLYEHHLKLTRDPKYDTRGRAVLGLAASPADKAEIVKQLDDVLATEKHEYVLRCATSAAQQLGADAKPLLPAIKKLIAAPDGNVKTAAAAAAKAIEEAKPTTQPVEEAKALAALRTEIQDAVTAGRAKGK
jgi:hypothetical protein